MEILTIFLVLSLAVTSVISEDLNPRSEDLSPISEDLSARYWSRPGHCKSPWVSIEGTKGCFRFIKNRLDWDDARSYCERKDGDLIILDTEQKRGDIVHYMDDQGYMAFKWAWHLGASDRSGSWRWINGQRVRNGWRKAKGAIQPDDDQGDDTCMYLYTDPYPSGRYDLLSDFKCTTKRYFICEKDTTGGWYR